LLRTRCSAIKESNSETPIKEEISVAVADEKEKELENPAEKDEQEKEESGDEWISMSN
jgi:hypothetical protein